MPDGFPQARGAASISLFGDVGLEITAASLDASLRGLPAGTPLTLRLFSYGGSAIEGLAIYNRLQRYTGKKTLIIDPLAASAASLIAMAGDEILIAENGFMMIHEPHAVAGGAAGDHRDLAQNLDMVSAQFVKIYAERSKKSPEEIIAAMRAETWLDAQGALDWGFADRIIAPSEILGATLPRIAAAAHYRNMPDQVRRIQKEMMNMQQNPATTPPQAASFADIKAIAERNKLGPDFIVAQFDAGATHQAALEAALEQVAAQSPKPFSPVRMGESYDDPEMRRGHMAEAIAARITGRTVSAPAAQWRGLSMAEMAAACLKHSGQRLPANARAGQIIQASLSTSDFPLLLQQSTNRILQDTLAVSPGAARMVCAMRSVPDFRPGRFIQFAGMGTLGEMTEGGPITYAPPAERGESFAVKTFARQVQFTRQMLVNDDLGALDQARLLAGVVVATEAGEFAKMFATNGAGWGPTLTDTNPLFHSSHGNVSAGTVGTAGISAGRVVMRAQTDAKGNLVAPEPRLVLVGPAGETAAEQALNDLQVATAESSRPVFAGRLALAVEPRLSGAPWFLFADPLLAPVLAMVTLEGTGGNPVVTQHESSDYDGLSLKVTHDFTIAPMGFVGAVRLTGA
jgi:ATP-dependent protease ClpP protease subunit